MLDMLDMAGSNVPTCRWGIVSECSVESLQVQQSS